MSDEKKKVSPVEVFKDESSYLRGSIPEELAGDEQGFNKGNLQLLKFHGSYQQDDRDVRAAMRERGEKGKAISFMIRSRIPGGQMTSAQLLAHLDIGDELANKTVRLTTRQGIQFHGVVKDDLRAVIQRINQCLLSTLAACGDVNRNVMCTPSPYKTPVFDEAKQFAHSLAIHFAPRTKAYHEIWLDDPDTGEKELVAGGGGEEVEPIYGKHYLPRKFKMGVGFPDENYVDLYSQDIGFMAISADDNQSIAGYNILVGGGFGVTPARKDTFPAVGQLLCYAPATEAMAVAEAIVKVQRDFGNRADRKRARLKYLIADWGIEKFRDKVAEYYGSPLETSKDVKVSELKDFLGWGEQGDGKLFYGLNVENGRIADTDGQQLKTALREICNNIASSFCVTPHQSLLITDINPEDKDKLMEIFRKHNITLSEDISTVRRYSMACVAWPTCGLAITESERALPSIIDEMEVELNKLGLDKDEFTVRMTGCPNGCARPYNSDIGIVGKAKNKYTLFLGGRVLGDRLNFIYADLVPREELIPRLVPIFTYWKQEREAGETFGDFCNRKGKDDLAAYAESVTAG